MEHGHPRGWGYRLRHQGWRNRKRLSHEWRRWATRSSYILSGILALSTAAVLIWWLPTVADGGEIRRISDPRERLAALNDSRTLALQIALALGASVTVFVTVRSYALTRLGQMTDRYARTATLLASSKSEERMAAVYALSRLLRDAPTDHRNIVDLLVSFVRGRSPRTESDHNRADDELDATEQIGQLRYVGPPPDPDVQAALTVIARRPRHFESPWISLPRCNLGGSSLINGWLNMLHFQGSSLRGADLVGAKSVDGVAFIDCDMRGCNLSGASLPGAYFMGANLNGAWLRWCNLRGASFEDASLRNAILVDSDLAGADFDCADLSGADLSRVSGLTSAMLENSLLTNSTLFPSYLPLDEIEEILGMPYE